MIKISDKAMELVKDVVGDNKFKEFLLSCMIYAIGNNSETEIRRIEYVEWLARKWRDEVSPDVPKGMVLTAFKSDGSTETFESVEAAAARYRGISVGHINKCIETGQSYKGVCFDWVETIDK